MRRLRPALTSLFLLLAMTAVAHAMPRVQVRKLQVAFKPTDVIDIEGTKVPAAQVSAELDQLQEALEQDGISLRKQDRKRQARKLSVFPGSESDATKDKQALGAKVTKLRAVEAGGFAGMEHRELGRPPVMNPPRGGATLAPTSSPRASVKGPLDVAYEESLGNRKRASAFVTIGLEDRGTSTSVGCEATLEGGVYVFDKKAELVKVLASGDVSGTVTKGRIEVYLLGKAVDGFPKTGAIRSSLVKPIAPPEAKLKYGWGPLSVDIEGAVAGELRVDLTGGAGPSSGTKGRCAIDATPSLKATARARASVNAIAYKVGVEGNITLVDVRAPASAAIALRDGPPTIVEDFKAKVTASFLDGAVDLFVKTRIPRDGERFWDLDWDQVYRKNLFDWDGLKIDQSLASFRANETKL